MSKTVATFLITLVLILNFANTAEAKASKGTRFCRFLFSGKNVLSKTCAKHGIGGIIDVVDRRVKRKRK